MPHYQLLRRGKLFFILGSIVLFTACTAQHRTATLQNSSVAQSIDGSDLGEAGPSKITYNPKTRTNTYIWTEYYLGGFSGNGMNDYEPYVDSFGVRDKDEEPDLGLKFGLEYIGKGAKFPGAPGPGIRLNYLEIPIDVIYHYPLGPGSLRGGLGPYFAEGIGGGGANAVYGENAGGFKRFDAGLNFTVGYKLAMGLSLDFGYDLGLANIEYANQDVTGHNRCWSINLGFQIGKLFAGK
jgi:Outer membrane protein beta-barrel domain